MCGVLRYASHFHGYLARRGSVDAAVLLISEGARL